MKHFIGIDIGSSSVKFILINENGDILNKCFREYQEQRPQIGWREIDPEIWYQTVVTGINELLSDSDRQNIDCIGITGQMHTTVFLDVNGNSIRPAIMWNDVRTRETALCLKKLFQQYEETSYLASTISTGSPAANLYWLKIQEPNHFAQLAHFLIGPDYLVYRLTGTYQTDYCEASTSSLFDWSKKNWSKEVRKILGFPDSIYPSIHGSGEIAGTLLPEFTHQTGLRSDVKVLVGTGDNPSSAVSAGCFIRKSPLLSLGTSGVLMFPKKKSDFTAKGKNVLFSSDGNDFQVLIQGTIQSCGSDLNWWMRDILHTDISQFSIPDHECFEENPLIFYPHLTGDKTLYQSPELRGAFLGLSLDTTRENMNKAILEGIAFGVRQLIEEMGTSINSIKELLVIGGGSKNTAWLQILSDVLNKPIIPLSNIDAVYGIALLAASAHSRVHSLPEADSRLSYQKTFYPQAQVCTFYEKKYLQYIRIYDALKDIYFT